MKKLHYGWVMVAISAATLAMYIFGFYSSGIFLKPLTEQFGWDRGDLSMAYFFGTIGAGFLALITGRIADRHGPRFLITATGILAGAGYLLLAQVNYLWQFFVLYGGMVSVSSSCCVVPITTTIPRWFNQKRGLALGLTWTGIGIGGIIAPILVNYLIDTYSWRFAFIVLGIINLVGITTLAQFMKRNPQQMGIKPYGDEKTVNNIKALPKETPGYSFKEAVRTARFWMLGLIMFCFLFIHHIVINHVPAHINDLNISGAIAASTISIVSFASLLGRNGSGLISDRIGARRTVVFCLMLVVLVSIWLIFSTQTWMFYTFALLYGVAYGGIITMQTAMTIELFGTKSAGSIFAGVFVMGTTGGAVGPVVAGYLFDITGTYHIAFISSACLCGLALLTGLFLLRSRDKQVVALTGLKGYTK